MEEWKTLSVGVFHSSILPLFNSAFALPLAELEASAGSFAAVLLALFDARVAGEESELAQRRSQLRVGLQQGLADSVPYRAGLSADSTALAARDHVESTGGLRHFVGLLYQALQDETAKVFVCGPVVNGKGPASRRQPHARHGVLALSGSIIS